LTLRYTELAHAIDHVRNEQNLPPAILVWENVPGVLSDRSNAFGAFLGALAGESQALEPPGEKWTHAGYVSGYRRRIAWRVLDAQYFGVAQRRRRTFLVASGRTDIDPGEILFERDSLRGHPAPGGETPQEAAGIAARRADSPDRALCFGSGNSPISHVRCADCPKRVVCFGGGNTQGPIDRAACLTAKGHRCDFEVETFAVQSCTGPVSHALTTANNGRGCSEDGSGRGVPIVAFAPMTGKPGQGRPVVRNVALRGRAGGMVAELGNELATALRASGGGGDKSYVAESLSCPRCPNTPDRIWRVRRLMPVECERLQGIPDHYTQIPYRGRPAADAPRYRVIGNSMAVPCMAWLGRRLQSALAKETSGVTRNSL
jgi:DNA (cytosine-5)-methyltransferase 1